MKYNHYLHAIAAATITTTSLFAVNWSTISGDWETPGNWQSYRAPAELDSASISNDGHATLSSPVTISELDLGFHNNGTLTINAGGSLTTTQTQQDSVNNIGQRNGSQGVMNIDGGNFRARGHMDGTSSPNDVAKFNMTSGSLVVEGSINASRSGSWQFNASGGTLSIFEIRGSGKNKANMHFSGSSTFAIGEIGTPGRSTYAGIEMTFTPGSNFHFDIGGTTPAKVAFQDDANTHDAFFGNGEIPIDLGNCNLAIQLVNGFENDILYSDKFVIVKMQARSITGKFANVIDGRVFTADRSGSFAVLQTADRVVLSRYQSEVAHANSDDYVDIPEPKHSGIILGLFAIMAIGSRRRR